MSEISQFLVDVWNCGLFDQIIDSLYTRNEQEINNININEKNFKYYNFLPKHLIEDEKTLSLIGTLLWSDSCKSYFINNNKILNPKDINDEDIKDLNNNMDTLQNMNKRRANNYTPNGRPTANKLYDELTKGCLDEHFLISPYLYGELLGPAEKLTQPFQIIVHPQVGLICDIHSHLSNAEVIGLLAGKWNKEDKCLLIQAAFPCTSTDRRHDLGHTDVELDPEAEWKVRETIGSMGMQVVGWYHSHPKFKPDPSLMDIFNQQQYQMYTRDEELDLEPFVGLIVSTYDPQLSSPAAHHQWFTVIPYTPSNHTAVNVVTAIESTSCTNIESSSIEVQKDVVNDKMIKPVIHMPMCIDVQYFSIDSKLIYNNPRYATTADTAIEATGLDGFINDDDRYKNPLLNSLDFVMNSLKEAKENKIKKIENLSDNITNNQLNMKEEEIIINQKSIDNKSVIEQSTSVVEIANLDSDLLDNDVVMNNSIEIVEGQFNNEIMLDQEVDDITMIIVEDSIENNSQDQVTNILVDDINTVIDPDVIEQNTAHITDKREDNENDQIVINGSKDNTIVIDQSMNYFIEETSRKSGRNAKKREFHGDFLDSLIACRHLRKEKLYNGKLKDKSTKKKPKIIEKIDTTCATTTNNNIKVKEKRQKIEKNIINNDIIMINNNENELENQIIKEKDNKIIKNKLKTKNIMMKTEVNEIIPIVVTSKHTLYTSFIMALKSETKESSRLARNLLFSIVPHLRYIALSVISLGLYYSRSAQRIDLSKKWKGQSILEKIKYSSNIWINKLFTKSNNIKNDIKDNNDNVLVDKSINNNEINSKLINMIADFLLLCWEDYSKPNRKRNM